ncbi:hypothetical protein H9L39_20093 [Fusarium oxysporum f. sp. albedinis]|nr:hypothetical protein H9L39_20093 [Fusarium oxysporum f. sp. albedinis]
MHQERNKLRVLTGKAKGTMRMIRVIPTISRPTTGAGTSLEAGGLQYLRGERKCHCGSLGRKSSDLPKVTEHWASMMEL